METKSGKIVKIDKMPTTTRSAKKGPKYAGSDVGLDRRRAAGWSVLKEEMMSEKKLNLVMVDDDMAIVRIVEHIIAEHLSDLFDAVAFTDSRQALEWVNEYGCDVLVSDLEMPEVGGLDLLRAAKQRQAGLQTILLTAHSSWERIAEAIEHGVDDYLLKPVDHAQLVDLLRQKHKSLSRLPIVAYDGLNGTAVECSAAEPISR